MKRLQRIEFVGPTGAGKTSVFERILKNPAPGCQMIKACQAKKKILLEDAWNVSPAHYMVLRLLGLSKRLDATLITGNTTSSAWKAIERQAPEWKALVGVALSQDHGDHVSCADQLIRTSWFIRDLADVALLLECADVTTIAVHDESLLQRGVGFGLGEKEPEAFADRFFYKIPAPDLVVHVDVSDPGLLMKRVRARPRDESRFINHLPKTIEFSRAAARIMHDKSVPVVYCDGTDDVSVNASRISREIAAILNC